MVDELFAMASDHGPESLPLLERIRDEAGSWGAGAAGPAPPELIEEYEFRMRSATFSWAQNEFLLELLSEQSGGWGRVPSDRWGRVMADINGAVDDADDLLAAVASVVDAGFGWTFGYHDWLALIGALSDTGDEEHLELIGNLCVALPATQGSDEGMGNALLDLLEVVNLENPGFCDELSKITSSVRSNGENPLTADAAAAIDLEIATRRGEPAPGVDTVSSFGLVGARSSGLMHVVEQAIIRGDKEEIRNGLELFGDEELGTGRGLALAMLGNMQLEESSVLAELQAEARLLRHRALVDSWALPDLGAIEDVLLITEVLGDREVIPKGWFDRAINRIGRSPARALAIAHWHHINGNWRFLATVGAMTINNHPHEVILHFRLGLAYHHLGESERAILHLEIFRERGRHLRPYPAAVLLLDEIRSDEPTGTEGG